MTQPTGYTPQSNFTQFSAATPSAQQPGANLDAEFNAIKLTLAQTLANLALIQRDDTGLANQTVGIDQIKPEVTLGLNSVTTWLTATQYKQRDAVWVNSYTLYRCLVAHTSGVFATDLAAGDWALVVDLSIASVAAAASATAAAGSATAALASQTAAATSATSAAASAAAAAASAAVLPAAAYVDVASGSTTNIFAANDTAIRVTGTTQINAFDTVASGLIRFGRFASTPLVKNNASIIIEGGADFQAAAGDQFIAISRGSGVTELWLKRVGTGAIGPLLAGTSANNVVQLDGSAKLPAVDGSALTNISAPKLLATLTASASASLSDTTHLTSTYKSYEFKLKSLVLGTAGQTLTMQITEDGSTWLATNYDYALLGIDAAGTSLLTAIASSASAIFLTTNTSGNAAAGGINGSVVLTNPADTTTKKQFRIDTTNFDNGSFWNRSCGVGVRDNASTAAVVGVRFIPSSGTITSGEIEVWGSA